MIETRLDQKSTSNARPSARASFPSGSVRRWVRQNLQYISLPFAFVGFMITWQAIVSINQYPKYILPAPEHVATSWLEAWKAGAIQRHLSITLLEIAIAFGLAFLFATVVGYALAKSPLLEKVLAPYLVASQAIPVIVFGPLIVIWINTGPVQNAMIGALVCFFPMMVNTIVGIRAVRGEYYELMHSFASSRWQVLTKLEIPAALPIFFGGLRIGVTLSVIGVVVVELLWADRGLGFLLNFARGQLDTPLLFAAAATLAALALALYSSVALIERLVIHWRRMD